MMEPDELRIIAKDERKLSPPDRVLLNSAADDLEAMQRALITTQMLLIESNAMRIATTEQLIEARKTIFMPTYTVRM